jgi:lipopolysaccharide transport system ATP-binding protein
MGIPQKRKEPGGGTVSDIAVRVDNVSKSFRMYHERNQTIKSAIMRGRTSVHEDFWALRDVSFEVPSGSTFGLIGSNGSGKSTLLKCLANIYYPNKGSISHFGKLAAMLEVGSGFHHELSGRENVFLNGSILGMSKKEITRKFDEIVDFSGVEQFIDQPVKNYSSGMYVRLGFAIAINVEPDILVVDEVLAVGDAEFQQKCFDKFEDLKHEGKTVILVSHSMATVRSMCDQAAWLNKGELMMSGDAEPTIKAYIDSVGHSQD